MTAPIEKRDAKRSRWTILWEVDKRGGHRRVMAECSCGTTREVALGNITSGASLSCGCMKENLGKRRLTHDERFWSKVERRDEDECWPWGGYVEALYGYGLFHADNRSYGAHRWMYLAVHGSIPEGLVVDHVCHNRDETCEGGPSCAHRRCVNPKHLEAVTGLENVMRGSGPAALNARKTHCDQGHELTAENTYSRPGRQLRDCRACRAEGHQANRWPPALVALTTRRPDLHGIGLTGAALELVASC